MADKKQSLQADHGLTDAEVRVVMARTDGGKGDVDAAARQVLSERVGPDAVTPAQGDESVPVVSPEQWPGPQGTDLPHPDEQVARAEAAAAEPESEKKGGKR